MGVYLFTSVVVLSPARSIALMNNVHAEWPFYVPLSLSSACLLVLRVMPARRHAACPPVDGYSATPESFINGNIGGRTPTYSDDPANYCDAMESCMGYVFFTPEVEYFDEQFIGKGLIKTSILSIVERTGACAYIKQTRKFNNFVWHY